MAQLVEQAQSIPVDLEEKQAANKNLKFIIGGVLVIALIITPDRTSDRLDRRVLSDSDRVGG